MNPNISHIIEGDPHRTSPNPASFSAESLMAMIADPESDALDRLWATGELRQRIEALTGWVVDDARAEGVTWDNIGGMLGVSKQAAQQRWTPSRD